MAMELQVSGPFHSSLMKPATFGLKDALLTIPFSKPKVTYYSDIDGITMMDPEQIKDSLIRQLVAPVQWIKVIEKMESDGFTHFVEVGPGKVLGGLMKKISNQIQIFNTGSKESISALEGSK